MADHAISQHFRVQQQLDRLASLSPGRDTLGLERITALCTRLGNPQQKLPRVFHVAGTNGKGSTCAHLRAMLEASGRKIHAYSSPHLVRFNERIRIAGQLIEDDHLADLLCEVLDIAGDLHASFFEVTTAAAFLAFARSPADDVIIETGLGGRLDATNILSGPNICGITSLGIDHEGFLLAPEAATPADPMERIAFEKSGIIKSGSKVATLAYPANMHHQIAQKAAAKGAQLFSQNRDWSIEAQDDGFFWTSDGRRLGPFQTSLRGQHQQQNAALALAMLWLADQENLDEAAAKRGLAQADWPGRIEKLRNGPLRQIIPATREIWIDGGHNLDAAAQLKQYLSRDLAKDQPIDLVIGMLANKNAAGFLEILAPHLNSITAVPIIGHDSYSSDQLIHIAKDLGINHAEAANDLPTALRQIANHSGEGHIMIGGSLYLVGKALELNDQLPN